MAATALDVLTIAAMKAQLRIEPADLEHDPLIQSAIENAVAFVERSTGLPLVDRTETLSGRGNERDGPIHLARHVRSVTAVAYWTPTQELREAPAGMIEAADLGRIVESAAGTAVWPPEGGWPDRLGDGIQFDVVRGLAVTPDGVRQGVILAGRQYFEGFAEIRPTDALFTVLAPWVGG